jgi:hypothetical protein
VEGEVDRYARNVQTEQSDYFLRKSSIIENQKPFIVTAVSLLWWNIHASAPLGPRLPPISLNLTAIWFKFDAMGEDTEAQEVPRLH